MWAGIEYGIVALCLVLSLQYLEWMPMYVRSVLTVGRRASRAEALVTGNG